MNAMSAEIYDFLVSQTTHLAVLFFVTWGIVALCHKKSAHLRYLLWAVTLVKCLMPPLFTVPMAVLPEPTVTSPVIESTEVVAQHAPFVLDQPLLPAVLPTATTPLPEQSTVASLPVIEQPIAERITWWRPLETRQWMLLVWIAGLTVLLLGTGARAIRFGMMLTGSRIEIDDRLREKIQTLAQTFRPGLTVKAFQLEGISQPFVWGILKGVIYLPANFAQTSTENKRCSVLLHEIAHVVRLDPLVNLIQVLAQSVYWFHPMVWVANKKIRAEREKCCDEIAIAQLDTSPKEYGSAIIDTLMHEYKSRMAVPTLAVAGPVKNLEDRIKTIMKPGKQFYSRPSFKAWTVVCVLAVTLTPMAVALMPRTVDSAESSDSRVNATTSDYTVAFSNGSTVELVALCDYPSKGKSWWSPDGSPLAMHIFTHDKSSYTSDDPGYELVFRHTGDVSFKIDAIKGCKLKSAINVLASESLSGYRVHIPSRTKKIDMTLATPTGKWKTVHASKSVNGSSSATVRGKTLILAAMISAGEDSIVSCTDDLGYEDATRIIVVDSRGHEHSGVDLTDTGIKGVRQRSIRYKKLAMDDVAEVRFQICAYEYLTLKNISLPPNTKTERKGELIDRGPMIPGHSFFGEDLSKVLAVISDDAEFPIIADAEVLGLTSVDFDAMPLEVALDMVLAGTNYSWTKKDDYYLVSTASFEHSQTVPAAQPDQKKNLKRALEEELAKSIQLMDSVISARVHVVIPEQTLFGDEVQETAASVVLKTKPGHELDAANVAAITQFVAASVKGLGAEAVTVVDSQGNLLAGKSARRMSGGAGTVVRTEERVGPNLEGTVTTVEVFESSDGQDDPTPAKTLSYEDRRELNRLMAVYARIVFFNDVQGIAEVFNFESEDQKKRVLDMIGQVKPLSSQTNDETQSVYVVQIEPMANSKAFVSALCLLGRRYIAHSVTWVRTDTGWKVAMDLAKTLETQEQVKAMGAEAYGRLQIKTQLELWEEAQGPALVSLYESTKREVQLRIQAMQFAKLTGLTMHASMTAAQNQEQLDHILAQSPEAFRRDMIAKYRKQLGPAEKYGKLEFRMLYNTAASERSPRMTKYEEQIERNRLKNKGPLDVSAEQQAHIWLPLRPPGSNLADAVVETYQGQEYVLVSNQPAEIMTADGSWGILAVSPQSDAMGRRAIGLELDQPGGEKLRQITSKNLDRAMAIVVDWQVLSAPTIKAEIGPHVLITGQFAYQEVCDMMVSLQKGMRPQSVEAPTP